MARIEVGTLGIQLPDVDPKLDVAFKAYYQAVAGGAEPDQDAFDAIAIVFLQATSDYRVQDSFFNSFTPHWRLCLEQGQIPLASKIWPWALRPVLTLEKGTGKAIHKGTPYYFWGMTELLGNNLQDGYLLLHRALEEDIRTHGTVTPSTPGFALATLDHTRPDQAFRAWVHVQAQEVERRLDNYRRTYGRGLDLTTLRAKYLSVPDRRESTQLYCYSMARARRLLELPEQIWEGPFPAQIAFDVLFDLCLVIDDSVRAKHPNQWKFIEHAETLSNVANLGLSRENLRTLAGQFFGDFPGVLRAILSKTFTLPNCPVVEGLVASLAIAYGCRNRGAHNVSAISLSRSEFDQLVQHLNEIYYLAVEVLY